MAKFKVGQRVRVVKSKFSYPECVGCEGTIVALQFGGYRLNVDGHKTTSGAPFYADEDQLEPLVNPDELAWQAFKSQHLTPDPALILAKEVA